MKIPSATKSRAYSIVIIRYPTFFGYVFIFLFLLRKLCTKQAEITKKVFNIIVNVDIIRFF
jgi:hypothetical protein